jgi:hypothetical protein
MGGQLVHSELIRTWNWAVLAQLETLILEFALMDWWKSKETLVLCISELILVYRAPKCEWWGYWFQCFVCTDVRLSLLWWYSFMLRSCVMWHSGQYNLLCYNSDHNTWPLFVLMPTLLCFVLYMNLCVYAATFLCGTYSLNAYLFKHCISDSTN